MTHIKVHEHGFVELVDSMGDDQRIVDSARVSIAGDKVKATSNNRDLIRYLLRHKHTTPFESVRFTFAVKLPIFVARQWMRHRMGSFNEMSARYSVLPDEFYVPEEQRMNMQAKNNHQGSDPTVVSDATMHVAKLAMSSKLSYEVYEDLLDTGLAREVARSVLPVNIYTKFYWTVDLWNLMHFLRLRLDAHAQSEIRDYGEAIYTLIKDVAPLACESFEDYILNAVTLSAEEVRVLELFLRDTYASEVLPFWKGSSREFDEFLSKGLIKSTT